MDEKFATTEKRLLETSFSAAINNFLYTTPSSQTYFYNMYTVSKEISGISLAGKTVQGVELVDFYLYHAKSDTVIDGASKYDAGYYFDNIAIFHDLSYDEWEKLQLGGSAGSHFSSTNVTIRNIDKSIIVCVNALPLTPTQNKLGALGVMMDAEQLSTILAGGIIDRTGAAFVLDASGKVLLKAGSSAFDRFDPSATPVSGLYQDWGQRDAAGDDRAEGLGGEGGILVTRIPSSVGGFTYVSVVPTKSYTARVEQIRTMTALFFSVMLVVGILISLLFAKRNASPIKSLAVMLRQAILPPGAQQGPGHPGGKDELDYIGETVLTTLAENRSVRQLMEVNLPLLQSSLITRLMSGTGEADIAQTLLSLRASGLPLKNSGYVVVAASIAGPAPDGMGGGGGAGEREGGGEDLNLARFAAANVLLELFSQISDEAYSANLGLEYVAILIGVDALPDRGGERIRATLEQASRLLRGHMSLYLRFGVGSAQPPEGVPLSFREARTACDFSFYSLQGEILEYRDINVSSQVYSYPVEAELALMNSVKNGNSERMQEQIRSIISENFENSTLSLDLARCLFFDIISTAVKITGEMRMNYSEAFETDPVSLLTSCNSIAEMEQALIRIFGTLCHIANGKKLNHNERLKNAMLLFIDQDYGNKELNLSTVADVFHLSPAYVSRFLKEYAGINFMDYLRAKRIDKAVEHLLNARGLS
ncbi:MAG: hypothetical protein LBU58_08660, partial [Clostridiales bacterium]|nr:hypothetical protein [Clostridiales bacterium]